MIIILRRIRAATGRVTATEWILVAVEGFLVFLGIFAAIQLEQWAEDRNWQAKANASKTALRDELALHYGYAVEFRVVYPCLQGQLDGLRDRVLSSGAVLDPSPLYDQTRVRHVIRMPAKFYPSDVWEESLADGTAQHLEAQFRRRLLENYASIEAIEQIDAANTETEKSLLALARPLPLDPSTRYSLVREIELLSGRLSYLDLLNGQLLDSVEHLKMVPPGEEAERTTKRYGTYHFCQEHGLPLRSFEEAMKSIPN